LFVSHQHKWSATTLTKWVVAEQVPHRLLGWFNHPLQPHLLLCAIADKRQPQKLEMF
jgi:hypothetical protein